MNKPRARIVVLLIALGLPVAARSADTPALPAGTYTAQASAPGYQDGSPTLARVGSGSTTLNFLLAPEPLVPGDVDGNGTVNAVDIQLVVNKVLGVNIGDRNADINGDIVVNALDVQLVVNAVLGIGS